MAVGVLSFAFVLLPTGRIHSNYLRPSLLHINRQIGRQGLLLFADEDLERQCVEMKWKGKKAGRDTRGNVLAHASRT